MANPRLPNLSSLECAVIYSRLAEYNHGRASFKADGSYLIVLPYGHHVRYTLWIASPNLARQKYFPIGELSESIDESLRMASTWLFLSRLPIHIVEYSEKHMQGLGDDIISFGKYRGHTLCEIRRIDPRYLWWLAYKYAPSHPKANRFQQIAQLYDIVNQDLSRPRSRSHQQSLPSGYLGNVGDKLTNLTLQVTHVRLEDDPYKTHYEDGKPIFSVIQRLTLIDPEGHQVFIRIRPHYSSRHSGQLAAFEKAYQIGDMLYVKSAKVAQCIQGKNGQTTRLNYVVLETVA